MEFLDPKERTSSKGIAAKLPVIDFISSLELFFLVPDCLFRTDIII